MPPLSLCLARLQEAARGLVLTNCTSIYFVELQSLTEYRWPFLLYPSSAAMGKNTLISKHRNLATCVLCHLPIASFPLQHLLPAWLRMLSRVWLCMLILDDLYGGLFFIEIIPTLWQAWSADMGILGRGPSKMTVLIFGTHSFLFIYLFFYGKEMSSLIAYTIDNSWNLLQLPKEWDRCKAFS